MTSYDQVKPVATGFPVEAPMVPCSELERKIIRFSLTNPRVRKRILICSLYSSKQFSNFVLDCSSCLTCWCPCITFGQTSEIVDRGLSSCGVNGALYALIGVFTGCSWIYSCTYRTKFRRTYNLEGSDCKYCLIHFWCESCDLCQQYRELKNRGYDVSLGWHGNVERGIGDVATAPLPVYGTMNR
ncbi:hypothetical protein MKX03_008617 [Papaver bracteatum]|nr:hypothetical protein MKX03_008617 [Papaver bracteatum]